MGCGVSLPVCGFVRRPQKNAIYAGYSIYSRYSYGGYTACTQLRAKYVRIQMQTQDTEKKHEDASIYILYNNM